MIICLKGKKVVVLPWLNLACQAVLFLLIVFSFHFLMLTSSLAQEEEKVSDFGKYKGYSYEMYDAWVRTSHYITVRDGTKLAIDIFRPEREGQLESEPLPVVWTHNRYRRAVIQDGKLYTMLEAKYLQTLIKHGYVIAVVDVRGSGASFGTWQGIFTREETQDAYEIIEWLANQPWCNGKVGMFGGSYLGITQLMAASTRPPHLKAIFPLMALFDGYPVLYPGGVYHDDFAKTWSELTKRLDTEAIAAPVDDDKDGILLREAIEAHKLNRSLYEIFLPLHYRNSKDEATGAMPYFDWSPSNYVGEINQSGVAVYLWGGWFDAFTRDCFVCFENLTVPKRLTMGPTSHSPRDRSILADLFKLYEIEQLRWFDYWLKDIDNGIANEAPINYYVMGNPEGEQWKKAQEWPLPEAKHTKYYFEKGFSGSIKSVNDGLLSLTAPQDVDGSDEYAVDYSTTSGQTTRWDNTVGGGFEYPNMAANDGKGLTYTTSPLAANIEITGHPILYLWAASTAQDVDFFAYLEEVDAEGVSHYITEGTLRASHRALHEPPYDNLNLPYHRSFDEDVIELTSGEPSELIFDLHPTSNIFDAGHRIRITITNADKDNALSPELSPPPKVTVYRNAQYASYISLPVVSYVVEKEFPLLPVIIVVVAVVIIFIIFAFMVRKKKT
jgi:putative CocE/NonD family hydrolase